MKIKLPVHVKSYKVKSKSHPGTFHQVDIMSNEKLYCDCVAGKFNRDCRHKKIIKNYIHGNK